MVGGLTWTNSGGGGGTVTAGGWNFTATLQVGTNVITVTGTNIAGDVALDSVTVCRAAPPSPNAGALIAEWTFDNTLADATGHGFDGTLGAGTISSYMAGMMGNAISITSVNDSIQGVQVAYNAALFQTNYTESVWVKFDAGAPAYQGIITRVGGNHESSYAFIRDYSGSTLYRNDRRSTEGAANGSWYHLVMMGEAKNGGAMQFYINGVACTMSGYNNWPGSDPLTGLLMAGGNFTFSGVMDDASMWSNTLSATQVKALYNLGTNSTLHYTAGNASALFAVFDGSQATASIGSRTWNQASGLSGTAGDVVSLGGGDFGLILDGAGNGVSSAAGQGSPSAVLAFEAGRGADYGQVQLAWSNRPITVLACTNRSYSTNDADWFVLSSGVSTPWTHTAASNFPSVYYRIVGGSYTSQYAVGKYDVNIAAGSIAWLSFPFSVQVGCDVLSDWFGQQLEARQYTSYNFPSLQRQSGPGGTIQDSDYYVNGSATNWFPTDAAIAANAGYVLFLPQDHGAVKVTGIGMVQTNNVTMQIPYNSVPWIGLAYDVSLDMRNSGLTNLFTPPRLYSSFNYDCVDSQQTPGGPICHAEYYMDNWGTGATNFFPSMTGADKLEPGKGYLLFFSTTRSGTGTWTCVRPY